NTWRLHTLCGGLALLTLEIPKHRGTQDAVLLHQCRDWYAAAVFIPQRPELAGRQWALAARGGGGCRVCPWLPTFVCHWLPESPHVQLAPPPEPGAHRVWLLRLPPPGLALLHSRVLLAAAQDTPPRHGGRWQPLAAPGCHEPGAGHRARQ